MIQKLENKATKTLIPNVRLKDQTCDMTNNKMKPQKKCNAWFDMKKATLCWFFQVLTLSL